MEDLDRITIAFGRFVDTISGLPLARWYSQSLGYRGTVLVADPDEVIAMVNGRAMVIPTGQFLREWDFVLEVPSGD